MLNNLVIFEVSINRSDSYNLEDVIEFGALLIKSGEAIAKKHCLVCNEYQQDISDFLGNNTIVCHNSEFQLSILEKHLGYKISNDIWDTLELARIFNPTAGKYTLDSLVRILNINFDEIFSQQTLNNSWVIWRLIENCWQKGMELDLSFYSQNKNLFQDLKSETFFHLLEKAVISSYPNRPIKTGIVLTEEENLFSRFQNSNDISLDEKWISMFFDHEGVLEKNLAGYESREGQKIMAEQITKALINSTQIVIEAGTGIGKSFAYLIPSLWWAKKYRRKVIVATNTIPLQEQLDKKDLPLLKEVLPFSFRTAILKGKSNYLCIKNWLNTIKNPHELTVEEKVFFLSIYLWIRETRSGDLQELSYQSSRNNFWYLSAENDCLPQKCSQASRCFLLRAKEKAESADLIVINHSLLLADIKTGFNILPHYTELIIDEAHHLYHTALKHLGWDLSLTKIIYFMDRLAQTNKSGFYYTAKSQLINLAENFTIISLDKIILIMDKIPILKDFIIDQSRNLFSLLEQYLGNQTTLRLRPNDFSNKKWDIILVNFENLYLRIDELNKLLKELNCLLDYEEGDQLEVIRIEIQGYKRETEEIIEGLKRTCEIGDNKWVRWLETTRNDIHLKISPVEVYSILQDRLFSKLKSVILTSATLSIAGQFEHFLKEIGLSIETNTVQINSPFNYEKQMRFFVVNDLFTYHPKDQIIEQVANFISEVCQTLNGKTLVLFTSHYFLREVNKNLQAFLPLFGINVFAQGVEGSRSSILQEFINSPKAVLLGANSFWEGIDLPGDTLTCVIMVKLPFSPPTQPLIEAQSELLKEEGKNPFQELLLPEAIIRFKQGFGRLIRRKTDRGIIILLDSRPLQKSYGKLIFKSLPIKSFYHGSKGFVLRKIEEWKSEKN